MSTAKLFALAPARKRPAAKPLTIVQQVRAALRPKARLATSVGFLLGGFVPLASYVLAHLEFDQTRGWLQITSAFVAGGLIYSAKTVYEWASIAFQHAAKAAGFVVLLEGVMVASKTGWLSLAALVYLVVINGVATGCNLARGASAKVVES